MIEDYVPTSVSTMGTWHEWDITELTRDRRFGGYDSLSQLVRENNTEINKTVTYAYSEGGNLTEKKIYSYTTGDLTLETPENTITYNYEDSNWPDKLTSYTDGASTQNIIYDSIGNPLEYRGWELEWARGRRLDKMSNSGYNVNISFKYDENGIRTQKTVGDVQTDFVTSGIKVLAQKTGENTIIWQTDANGNTVGFNYNGAQYFYLKNAQGDVIGITDTSGEIVANYTYDSWGKLISITDSNGTDKTTDASFIGCINPLRYRGYYYDSETSLYYLNARYYDPEIGRFINADDNLSDLNLFRYCANNPVNTADYNGCLPVLIEYMTCVGATVHTGVNGACVSYNCWNHAINTLTGVFKIQDPPGFSEQRVGVIRTIDDLAVATIQGVADAGARRAELLVSPRGTRNFTDTELNAIIGELAENQYLIAMRMDTRPGGDYHYMKFENGVWTQKYGKQGALFQLIGVTPNDDRVWRVHYGDHRDGTAHFEDEAPAIYTSEVWYIKITKN